MARQSVSKLNENQMAARICNREDNHFYKHQMIKEILQMYSDEIYKAMLNGERVQISKVGTIIPEIKIHEGKYNMPTCNKTEGNPPPYAKIRISDYWSMRENMNRKLMQNIKNGIYGLKKLLFNVKEIEFLKETGYIPEDADISDYEEE